MAKDEENGRLAVDPPDAKYMTIDAPSFTVKLGEGLITAVNSVLTVPGHLHQELKNLMKGRPDIGRHLRLIDREAAVRVAKAHQAAQAPAAMQGAMHSNVDPGRIQAGAKDLLDPNMIASGEAKPTFTATTTDKAAPAAPKPLTGLAAKLANKK